MTFSLQQIAANLDSGRSIPRPQATSVTPGQAATTFDALFPNGLVLNSSRTIIPRPAQARPTGKSTGPSAPAYFDQAFGPAVFQVTSVADDLAGTATSLTHDYPKRQFFNADGSKYIAVSSGSWWHLYSFPGFAHITVPGGTLGRLPGISGTDANPHWHPTDPTKLWYTADFGGLTWYELDITTGVSSVLFTFSGRLPTGFSQATRFHMGSEGRPSDDGRFWGFMACRDDFSMVGLMAYDRQADAILSSAPTSNKPNWCGVSPDGAYVVPQWHNNIGGLSLAAAQTRPMATADGTRAYPINGLGGSVWQQLDTTGEHGDVGRDYLGRPVWLSTCYSPYVEDVAENATFYRRMDNGEAVILQDLAVTGLPNGGVHHSCTAFNRPGKAVMTFDSSGTTSATWKDGAIVLVDLRPTGQDHRRLAHHQSDITNGNSPFATPNRDLTAILFRSDFRGGAAPYPSYMLGLPSGAIPA